MRGHNQKKDTHILDLDVTLGEPLSRLTHKLLSSILP